LICDLGCHAKGFSPKAKICSGSHLLAVISRTYHKLTSHQSTCHNFTIFSVLIDPFSYSTVST
jgi:hypothetical protein